jgi:hypothetical protein
MVPSNSKGEQLADVRPIKINRHNPTRRCMIHCFGRPGEPSLEFIPILAEIVQQTCYVSNGASAELAGALCGSVRNCLEMISQRLPIMFIL